MKAKSLQINIHSGYDRLENMGEKRSVQWLTWGIYTLIIIVFAWRHEPWGDEYHVWGMVHNMSAWELLLSMRREGHFCLWHFMQWPFVKWLGMDWHSLYIVSVSLMSLAAWLLLRKVDFPFVGKILIVFSVPFFYSFPIISRCYALIPPILMGIAVLYQQKKYPALYCMLVGLLANTHVYIEGLVAALWCSFFYHNVWNLRKASPQQARKNAYKSLITIALVLLAFLQVILGLYDVSKGKIPGSGMDTPERWIQTFYGSYQINVFQNLRNYFPAIPNLDLLATLCCYVLIIICAYKIVYSYDTYKKEAIIILFCGLAWQVLFATNIYGMQWQRIGLLYFSLIVVWLLYYDSKTKKRCLCLALLCCWLLNTSSQLWVVKDLWKLYDPAIKIAAEINSDLPDNCLLNAEDYTGIGELLNARCDPWWPELIEDYEKAEHVNCWWLLYGEKAVEIDGCEVSYINGYYYDSYEYLNGMNKGGSYHLYHIEK